MHSQLVRLALAEVGTREEGGNNRGDRIREYQRATWLAPDDWPWCAAFTCWILRQWLATTEGKQYLGAHKPDVWRCKDASAFGWEKWAKQKGLTLLPETQLAQAGDIATFDFSHIGIVAEDQLDVREPVVLVEGNTNGTGSRDSESGDGVWVKHRRPGLIRRYIRLGSAAP